MSKKRRIVLLCLVVCLAISASILLSACKKNDPAEYTVTYASGNSAATGTAPDARSYKEGDTVTVANNTFTLTGHTFDGWSDGTTTYEEGDTFPMPNHDVTLTAKWKSNGSITPEPDVPTLAELDARVYDADSWAFMTNNSGASLDGGSKTVALNDGSVKFHFANQAVELDDKLDKASFMLKATNDFAIWFNSSSKDNQSNYSYRLVYASGELRLVVSTSANVAAAVVTSNYAIGEWNRFDIEFEEIYNADRERTVTNIKLYVNGVRATLTAGGNTNVTVADNVLSHEQANGFATGSWLVAKVWNAENYLQIKPVAKANVKDVPIIAAVGASITEGAGSSNQYAESYPAQLQGLLGGDYNVINYGKSGRTVRTDTGNDSDGTPVPWLNNTNWDGVQTIKPDIVVINMGTNDSKTSLNPVSTLASFKAAYNHLIDELLAVNPDMRIIACTVPTAYSAIWDINNDNIENIIRPAIMEIVSERQANDENIELVDLYTITQNKSLLFGDGVHPGARGYKMFAEIIEKVILEGEDALTQDFLDAIDEEYNDFEYVIEDIHAELAEVDGEVRLTVTGYIEIEDTTGLRIVVTTGKAGQQERELPITLEGDGTFSVTMRLDDLTGTDWYNVRIYLNDNFNHLVTLAETNHVAGQNFTTETTKVIVRTWNSGETAIFSFSLEAYDGATSVTATNVYFEDGDLVFEGVAGGGIQTLVVYLYDTNEGIDSYNATATIGADRSFTVRIGLEQLTASNGNWYFLRYRANGGEMKSVSFTDFDTAGHAYKSRVYYLTNGAAIAVRYETNTATDLTVTLTTATITQQGDQLVLKLEGTTTDTALQLYVGNSQSVQSFYHDVTVTAGEFSVTFDLFTLGVSGDWYNVRLCYTDGVYYELNLADITNVAKGKVFYGTDRKLTIESWNNTVLNLYVQDHDSSYSVTANEVKFEDGYVVVIGETTGVRTLIAYLRNNDTDLFPTDVTLESDGSFTVRLGLAQLVAADYNWYYIEFAANGGDRAKVAYQDYDASQLYGFENRIYRWQYSGGVAIDYITYDYGITTATITNEGGVATLTIEGEIYKGTHLNAAANTITLILNRTAAPAETKTITNLATEAGKFRFTFDLSQLTAVDTIGTGAAQYFIRLYVNGTKVWDVNSRWAAAQLFETVEIGNSEYCFGRNSATDWNTLGIMRRSTAEPAPEVHTTELYFEEGYVVLKGTVENVTSLVMYLKCDKETTEFSANATITSGNFEVRVGLEQLTAANKEWYYIRVSVNGSSERLDVIMDADKDTPYVYGTRSYKFTDWQGNCKAVTYEDAPLTTELELAVTSATLVEEGGKLTLTIIGTTNDEGLRLFITDGGSNQLYQAISYDNGNFTVSYDLFTVPVSGSWYNVRLLFSDDAYHTIGYADVIKDGTALKNNDEFVGTDRKVKIQTWNDNAGVNGTVATLSLSVTAYDASYTITATSITFSEQYLVVSGTATGNVNTLVLALHNDTNLTDNIRVTADVIDGQFTVQIDLTQLTIGSNGTWFYLWSSVNGGADAKIDFAKNDTTHTYGNRVYRFEYYEGIAIAYNEN